MLFYLRPRRESARRRPCGALSQNVADTACDQQSLET